MEKLTVISNELFRKVKCRRQKTQARFNKVNSNLEFKLQIG